MLSLPNILSTKSIILAGTLSGFLWLAACSPEKEGDTTATEQTETPAATSANAKTETTDSKKGVGPVSEVKLDATLDKALADQGKTIFESKCAACHKFGERYVGPNLAGITERREPEWIMNMVLNPQEMTQKDDTAKALLGQFMTQMPNQNLKQEEARAVLEYFRSVAKK